MQRFKNILVYVGTNDPETAIRRAFEIAKENKAVVTLMDVIKPLPGAIGIMTDVASPDELEHLLIEDRGHKLVELANQFCRESLAVEVLVRCGDPVQQITKRVLTGGHDLVIKTAVGASTTGRFFSSVARSLLRVCPCPVWMLKPKVHEEYNQVLAAIDLDADDEAHLNLNKDILELAYAIARRDRARLHVVSVWDMWMEHALRRRAGNAEVDAALAKREAKVRKRLDRLLHEPFANADDIQVHLQHGQAAANILAVANQIETDLVVMGTVCRTGVAGFLIGNTAENLLSELTCSVLALKPAGFQSPIHLSEEDESVDTLMLPMI